MLNIERQYYEIPPRVSGKKNIKITLLKPRQKLIAHENLNLLTKNHHIDSGKVSNSKVNNVFSSTVAYNIQNVSRGCYLTFSEYRKLRIRFSTDYDDKHKHNIIMHPGFRVR